MPVGSIGKYERLDVLGHGTSGIVYLAWDTLLRRNVALKEIRAAGPEMERVIEEARLLERLRGHPNIVEVHSVDRVDGVVLIDMELVRGQTLADFLATRSAQGSLSLPPADAIRIAGQVLDALEHAHTRRIVHRDVKPANILIANDGAVKLTDFGLAEALGTGSVAGGGGTYPYMAPEDFAEEADSDYRSDLWAVGVLLYEMLTGRRPFNVTRKKDPFAWKRAIETEIPERPSRVVSGIPPALDDVVMKALAKNKSSRYPTAQLFAQSLRAVALPQVIGASAPPSLPRAPDGSPYLTFAQGAVAVFTLDQLRDAYAKYWEEGKQSLLTGQAEAFLRAIGEVYIAELAAELAAQKDRNPDTRLFEFIERSGPDEGDRSMSTVPNPLPLIQEIAGKARGNRFRIARQERKEKAEKARSERNVPGDDRTAEPKAAVPAPPPSPPTAAPPEALSIPSDRITTPDVPAKSERPRSTGSPAWFIALLVLCLAPPVAAAFGGARLWGGHGRFNNIQEALAITGLLSAMLLIAGTGAKVHPVARAFCFMPMAAGILCLGSMGAVEVNGQGLNLTDAPLRAAALLVAPLLLLVSEALTVKQGWKFWSGVICLLAGMATAYYLRPLFPA
ncbi:MAG: serine/threonine-protein kinase [Capsulimonadales bacterium]|nr:serine/threonine-protein kinase [Capsulimonadales bacterium]